MYHLPASHIKSGSLSLLTICVHRPGLWTSTHRLPTRLREEDHLPSVNRFPESKMPISTRSTSDVLSMATHDTLVSLEERLKRMEKREARLQRAFHQAQEDLQTGIGRLQNESEGRIRGLQSRADDARKQKGSLREQIQMIKAESKRRNLEKMLDQERELRKRIELLKEESRFEGEERERERTTLAAKTSSTSFQPAAAARPPSPPPTPTPPPPQLSPSPPPLTPVGDMVWEKMTIPYTICGECRKRGVDCYRSIELDGLSSPPQPPFTASSPLVPGSSSSSRARATHTAAEAAMSSTHRTQLRSQTLTKCLECKAHSRLCFTIEIPVPVPVPIPVPIGVPGRRPGPLSKILQKTRVTRAATTTNPTRKPSKRRLGRVRDSTRGGGPGTSIATAKSPERARSREQNPAEAAKRRRLALIEEALENQVRENRRASPGVHQGGQGDMQMDVDLPEQQRRRGNARADPYDPPTPPPPPPPPPQEPARTSPCPMNIVAGDGEAEWQEALRNARSVAHAAVSMERRLLDLSHKYFGEASNSAGSRNG